MAKIRINPEELENLESDKKPDSDQIFQKWFQANKNVLLILAGVAILIFVVLSYRESQRQSIVSQGSSIYADAAQKFQETLFSTEWASEERQSGMAEVVELADQIINDYPETGIAHEALFLKGTAYYQMGDNVQQALDGGAQNNDTAITLFTEYLGTTTENTFSDAKGSLALAYALENEFFLSSEKQSADDAMGYYGDVINNTNAGILKADAIMGRARIFSINDNVDEAIALYRELMDERYAPVELEAPLDARNSQEVAQSQLLNQLRQQRLASMNIVGLARLELSRLGVDVDKEYPLTVEKEVASPEESEETTG